VGNAQWALVKGLDQAEAGLLICQKDMWSPKCKVGLWLRLLLPRTLWLLTEPHVSPLRLFVAANSRVFFCPPHTGQFVHSAARDSCAKPSQALGSQAELSPEFHTPYCPLLT
jgi:hypothetical protein